MELWEIKDKVSPFRKKLLEIGISNKKYEASQWLQYIWILLHWFSADDVWMQQRKGMSISLIVEEDHGDCMMFEKQVCAWGMCERKSCESQTVSDI